MNSMTISELREKFVAGEYTPIDAVEEALTCIKNKDGNIHAFLDVYDDAREAAKVATERYKQEGDKAPAMLGVPVAIKHNILIKDKKATGGSKILECNNNRKVALSWSYIYRWYKYG